MNDSWTKDIDHYESLAKSISTVASLRTKNGMMWRFVGRFLSLCSFGRFSRDEFLEMFATTFGPIQAYPESWKDLSRAIIVHESRHTQQFLIAGWFVPVFGWLSPHIRVWAGVLPMALIYGFFPLPMFFCWGRFRLELDADAHSWRAGLEQGWLTPEDVRRRAGSFAVTVSSWSYLRAWPRNWAKRAFAKRAEFEIERWKRRINDEQGNES